MDYPPWSLHKLDTRVRRSVVQVGPWSNSIQCPLWVKSGHAGKRQQGRRLNADYSMCGCHRLHFLLPLAKRRQRGSSAVAKPALVARIRAKELGLAPLEAPPLL